MASHVPPVMTHSWKYMGSPSENPMGIEAFSLIAGLGFVLSFGYWCTDFLVVQRAMAADSMSAAQRTPVLAALPKMMMPFIVIVPGIAAIALMNMNIGYSLPMRNGEPDYNQAITTLMAQFYPAGMLGVGLTGLMASFMSGMAGNVTAFNTVWTYDIYQSYIRPGAPDSHYLKVGRITTVVGVALSVLAAYVAGRYNSLNDLLQLVFSFVNAPLFATFLLGMFWKRATGDGAFCGLMRARRRGAHARSHAGRRQGRLDRQFAHVPFLHGAEFLDRHLRLERLFPLHHRHQPAIAPAPRIGTHRPGVRANQNAPERRG